MGIRVPVLPVRSSGSRVQNSTRKPEVADDIIMTSTVHVYKFSSCPPPVCKGRVHCGVIMETLPDRLPVLPVENYPNPIPEENATRLSTSYKDNTSLATSLIDVTVIMKRMLDSCSLLSTRRETNFKTFD